MSDDQSAAAQWANLWGVYMRENRALCARAEAAEAEVARLRAALEQTTDNTTTTRRPGTPNLTPDALAEVYSLGAHRAIIDAADGHAAAPLLRALAHIGGLAHAAAGYPRHLLSPLRDVLAAVDRLPDAASLAAWALGELPAGSIEPRPDGEVERLRAEVAQARADAEATRVAAARDRDRMRGNVDAWRDRTGTAEAEVARLRAEAEHLRALLSEGVEIVDSLSAGYGVWTEAAGRAVGGER